MSFRAGGISLGIAISLTLSGCTSNGGAYNECFGGSTMYECEDLSNSDYSKLAEHMSADDMGQENTGMNTGCN